MGLIICPFAATFVLSASGKMEGLVCRSPHIGGKERGVWRSSQRDVIFCGDCADMRDMRRDSLFAAHSFEVRVPRESKTGN